MQPGYKNAQKKMDIKWNIEKMKNQYQTANEKMKNEIKKMTKFLVIDISGDIIKRVAVDEKNKNNFLEIAKKQYGDDVTIIERNAEYIIPDCIFDGEKCIDYVKNKSKMVEMCVLKIYLNIDGCESFQFMPVEKNDPCDWVDEWARETWDMNIFDIVAIQKLPYNEWNKMCRGFERFNDDDNTTTYADLTGRIPEQIIK